MPKVFLLGCTEFSGVTGSIMASLSASNRQRENCSILLHRLVDTALGKSGLRLKIPMKRASIHSAAGEVSGSLTEHGGKGFLRGAVQ